MDPRRSGPSVLRDPHQSRGEEAVEARQRRVVMRQSVGQRAQPALRRDERPDAGDLIPADRIEADALRLRCRISATISSPSEGSSEQLEKTILPPGLTRSIARRSIRRCRFASLATSSGPSSMARPDDAAPFRSRNTARRGAPRRTVRRAVGEEVGLNEIGREAEPLQVGVEPPHPPRRDLQRGDACTGRGELGRLATRCGAEVGDRKSCHIAEEPCRQRRGGILDPPGALGVSRKLRDRRGRPCHAHASRGQHDAASMSAQCAASALTVKSTGASVSIDASMRSARSAPRLRRDDRRTSRRRRPAIPATGLHRRLPGHGSRAEHRVDEAREPPRPRIFVGLRHREIHSRAVRHVQVKDLRQRHVQDVGERMGVAGQRRSSRSASVAASARRAGAPHPGWRAPGSGRGRRARDSADAHARCRSGRRARSVCR